MYHNSPRNSIGAFKPISADEMLPSFLEDDIFDFPTVSTTHTSPSRSSPLTDYGDPVAFAACNSSLSGDHESYSSDFMPNTNDDMPFNYDIPMQLPDDTMHLDTPINPVSIGQSVSQHDSDLDLTDGTPEDTDAYSERKTVESSRWTPSDDPQLHDLQGQNQFRITWEEQVLPDSNFIPLAAPSNRKYRFINETAHHTKHHTSSTNLAAFTNRATTCLEQKSHEGAQRPRPLKGPHVSGVSLNAFRTAKVSTFYVEGTRVEGGRTTLQPKSNTYTFRKRGDPSMESRKRIVRTSSGKQNMTYGSRWSPELTVPAPVSNPSDEKLRFTRVEFAKSGSGDGKFRRPDYLYSFFKTANRFEYQHSGIVQFELPLPAEKEYRAEIPCTVDTPQYGKIENCTYTVILEVTDPEPTECIA